MRERALVSPVRLERTTYSLEGCCSIQLSYGERIGACRSWHVAARDTGDPCSPLATRYSLVREAAGLVGARGFEPPTPCSQSRCATRLRYTPTQRAAERHQQGACCGHSGRQDARAAVPPSRRCGSSDSHCLLSAGSMRNSKVLPCARRRRTRRPCSSA
jgi:hypothetical protein